MIKISANIKLPDNDLGYIISRQAQKIMERPLSAENPLIVCIEFWMPRPKSHFLSDGNKSLKGKRASCHIVKQSIDDLTDQIIDSLSGVVWESSSQIVDLFCHKRYADEKDDCRVVVNIFQHSQYRYELSFKNPQTSATPA